MVVDCGGGTVDISTYARSSKGHFGEIAPAECNVAPLLINMILTLIQAFCKVHSSSPIEHKPT